jgi:hypothetical protein
LAVPAPESCSGILLRNPAPESGVRNPGLSVEQRFTGFKKNERLAGSSETRDLSFKDLAFRDLAFKDLAFKDRAFKDRAFKDRAFRDLPSLSSAI